MLRRQLGIRPIAFYRTAIPSTTGGQEVALLLAMRLVVLAFALLGQSLLGYALQPEGRGAYAVCVFVGALTAVVLTPGADRGSQYFTMTGQLRVSQGISVGLVICLFGCLAASALIVPFISSEFAFFQKASSRSFYLAIALSPFICFSSVVRLQLAGFRRFVSLALLSSAQGALNVASILILVRWQDLGVNGAILSLAVGHVLVIGFGLTTIRRHCQFRFEIPRPDCFKRVIGYGLREHVAKVTHAVDARIGALLLGLVAGRAEIGFFAAGTGLISRIVIISDAVSMSLLPRIARSDGGNVQLTILWARFCWGLTAVILAVWVMISTPVIRLLLSEAFLPSVTITWIVGFGFVVYSGADVFMTYFRGVNRPGVCSWAVWIGLCVNAMSFFPLYASFGLVGMAWAMALGLVCRSVYLTWMFKRTSGMAWKAVLVPGRGDVANFRYAGQVTLGRMREFSG